MARVENLPGSLMEAEFGGTGDGTRESPIALATGSAAAPPNATAAPTPTGKNSFTGLCEALNYWQQELVKKGPYKVADQYEIVFVPQTISAAKLKKPGTTNQSTTAMQKANTAKDAKDPATNSMATNTRTTAITAGMQIIQFIDQVLRGSSYISDQQKYVIDETTGKTKPNANNANGQVAWYKVSINATQLGWDEGRNDFAYRMSFIVSPYGINESPSEYFPKTEFRGVHKSYNYWFTGQNIEIISYEQVINALYTLTMSDNVEKNNNAETDPTALYRRSWGTRSEQSDQGAKGKTNEAAANLADALFTQSDFVTAKIEIVGDPGWIPQGEVSGGLTASTFSFAPFLSDGTINVDASEATFSITFNRPSDYDFTTGLIDFKNTQNQLQQPISATYKAIKCVSTFKGGRFTQNIEGTLLTSISKEAPPSEGRTPLVTGTPARPSFANTGGGAAVGNPRITAQGIARGATQAVPEFATQTQDAAGNPSTGPVNPTPMAVPKPATSTGGIQTAGQTTATGTATTAATNTALNLAPVPLPAGQASKGDPAVQAQLSAQEQILLSYTTDFNGNPRTINPGSLMARRVSNQEQVVADLRAKLATSQPGVNINPQSMRKDE
jgi:hypothetical protein